MKTDKKLLLVMDNLRVAHTGHTQPCSQEMGDMQMQRSTGSASLGSVCMHPPR